MFTAVLNAQTDTTVKQPVAEPATTQPVATEAPVNKDKYNNWSARYVQNAANAGSIDQWKNIPCPG